MKSNEALEKWIHHRLKTRTLMSISQLVNFDLLQN